MSLLDDDFDGPLVPAAAPRTAKESEVEKYLVFRVKQLGGEVRKVKWIGRIGAPDRVVMFQETVDDGGRNREEGRVIWCELKRPGKAATFPRGAHEEAQYREHERMRKMGQRVEVIDSKEGVDRMLAC